MDFLAEGRKMISVGYRRDCNILKGRVKVVVLYLYKTISLFLVYSCILCLTETLKAPNVNTDVQKVACTK